MADFNLIQRGDLQSRLVSALKINERSPAPTLEPTVQAVVLLEDLTKQTPFVQALERRCFVAAVVSLVAGQFPILTIANPDNSGVIMVIETAYAVGVGDVFTIGRITGAEPAGVFGGDFFDRRNGAPATHAARIRVGNFAASQIAVVLTQMQGSTWAPNIKLVLLPGEEFGIQKETVASQMNATIWWTEYPA